MLALKTKKKVKRQREQYFVNVDERNATILFI